MSRRFSLTGTTSPRIVAMCALFKRRTLIQNKLICFCDLTWWNFPKTKLTNYGMGLSRTYRSAILPPIVGTSLPHATKKCPGSQSMLSTWQTSRVYFVDWAPKCRHSTLDNNHYPPTSPSPSKVSAWQSALGCLPHALPRIQTVCFNKERGIRCWPKF